MTDPSATAVAIEATSDQPPAVCQNCGTPLLGPHCYACGQPVSGLVRHFSSMLGDALDSILNIDARVFRTLWPLLARPAYLTSEYFAGRRVRYVSPVRLFVFLSILTFFVARLTITIHAQPMQFNGSDAIGAATSIAQVEQRRDTAIAGLARGRRDASQRVPGLDTRLAAAETAIRQRADRRIAELKAATARGEPPPDPSAPQFEFDGKPWDAKTHPLVLRWLPTIANDWLNLQVARAETNIARMQRDPGLFKDAVLSAIPSTLFVLLPVFALMLEILYVFKRRLYMEHLIVALHSHAFMCLTLLLVFLSMALRQWVAPVSGALHSLLGLVEALLFSWMPVYLLLMQKRVYGQGWPITLVKYAVLGFCYTILLSIGAAFTIVASLVSA